MHRPFIFCFLVFAVLSWTARPVSAADDAGDASMQYPATPAHDATEPSVMWTRLQKEGPGHNAVVTLTDGTLRGGWIASVDGDNLHLQVAGETLPLAASNIALVRVKRPDRTFVGTVVGYLATATALTVVAYNDGNHDIDDLIVVFGVGGIPGGLLGAWIGRHAGGDIEIVP